MVTIVVIDGRPGVFTWTGGFTFRREESLFEQAKRSEEHLLQVCLWLEKHGRNEEAWDLMERLLPHVAGRECGRRRIACN